MGGRQILDTTLLANEVVEDVRQEGRKLVIVKLEFEKAYMIELAGNFQTESWIVKVLEVVGGGGLRVDSLVLVSRSLSIGRLDVGLMLIKLLDKVTVDLLSSLRKWLMFCVRYCVEVLGMSALMGCNLQVGMEEVVISHLQFTDDTILFLSDDIDKFKSLLSPGL